jgi:phospholipase/carboxylesterase
MSLETIEIETAPHPLASVIVLHGLGADGNDFVTVAEQLDLDDVGPVRFVLPHAPIRAVTINGGARMRAWYDVLGFDLIKREDEAGLRASQAEIELLLSRERARGIPGSRTVIAGFSQGGAMTLQAGLRHDQRLAGLAALSSYLPLAATTATERTAANNDVPIFFAHGRQDPMIAFARATASRDALVALSYPLEWHEYDMGHSVCAEEIVHLNRWLSTVLARR